MSIVTVEAVASMLLAIVSLFVLASTSYIGPPQVGLVVKRLGYSDPNRSKAPSPSNQL